MKTLPAIEGGVFVGTGNPERKTPKPNINPMMDAVGAVRAVRNACDHVRNVLTAPPTRFDAELSEYVDDIKAEMRRLSVLVAEWEGRA